MVETALKCDAKLARLAKRHIGIPATSVPSERVFSKVGELVSARRSRLKKSNVDILILNTKKMYYTLAFYPLSTFTQLMAEQNNLSFL